MAVRVVAMVVVLVILSKATEAATAVILNSKVVTVATVLLREATIPSRASEAATEAVAVTTHSSRGRKRAAAWVRWVALRWVLVRVWLVVCCLRMPLMTMSSMRSSSLMTRVIKMVRTMTTVVAVMISAVAIFKLPMEMAKEHHEVMIGF